MAATGTSCTLVAESARDAPGDLAFFCFTLPPSLVAATVPAEGQQGQPPMPGSRPARDTGWRERLAARALNWTRNSTHTYSA